MKTKIHSDTSNVGERIRLARINSGLSQQDLGDKVFKTGAAIGYIERGKRGINVDDLQLFAEALNVSMNYFFGDDMSGNQHLQDALTQLQKHISKLNQTITTQAKTINSLIEKLPSNTELRLISESSIDPIIMVDKNGKIIYVTPSIYQLIGKADSQLVGKSCSEVIVPNQADECGKMLRQVFETERVTARETKFLHANGKEIDVEINARSVFRKGEKVVHAVIRDISLRKKMQIEAAENKEKYVQLLKQSADGILVFNEDLIVVDWNKALEEISGLKKERVLNKSIAETYSQIIYPKPSARKIEYEVKNAKRLLDKENSGIERITRQESLRKTDGTVVDFHIVLFPIFTSHDRYVGAILRDISKEAKLKERIKRIESSWQETVDSMPALIVALDRDNKISIWNKECERAFGYKSSEITNNPEFLDMLIVDKKQLELVKDGLKNNKLKKNWKIDLRTKSGKVKTTSWSNIGRQSYNYEGYDWYLGYETH